MENQTPVTLNCLYRGPGENGKETQNGVTVAYGEDDVLVRIGDSFMRVDLEHFFMALASDDPLRTELGETVYNLQERRKADAAES